MVWCTHGAIVRWSGADFYMKTNRQLGGEQVGAALQQQFPDLNFVIEDEWGSIPPDSVSTVLGWLRESEDFDAAQLSNLTAVDRYDHVEVVYHLQSLDLNHQIAIKAKTIDSSPAVVESAYSVYKGALLQEREVYDLMGVRFEGHPDLRRLFLWDGFPGHPLRKDFMGMQGELTSGLEGFPYEDNKNPIRAINKDNLEAGTEYIGDILDSTQSSGS